MIRSIARSFAVAALVALALTLAGLLDVAALCKSARHDRAAGAPLLERGFVRALPGEQVYVCETRHCFTALGREISCHTDEGCYCLEPGAAEHDLTARLDGRGWGPSRCHLDEANPRPDDDQGACRHALCREKP